MWKRLQSVTGALKHRNVRFARIIQGVGESDESVKQRLERWKSGATDTGIQGQFRGGELGFIIRKIIVPPPREDI
jgi:hypothetical protein